MSKNKKAQTHKKNEISIVRSSAAEDLTFVAAGGNVVESVRPVTGLPDAGVIAAIHAEIMGPILRKCKLFTAVKVNRPVTPP